MTRVMGIDPSLRSLGVALDGGHTWTLNPGTALDARRLHLLAGGVRHLVTAWRPDLVVLEALILHGPGAGGAQHRAELIGCLKRDLFLLDVPYVEVNPARLKRWATGHGNAKKAAMVEAAEVLGYNPANDDEADAALLAELGRHAYGTEALSGDTGVDRARLEVVAAITWPVLASSTSPTLDPLGGTP